MHDSGLERFFKIEIYSPGHWPYDPHPAKLTLSRKKFNILDLSASWDCFDWSKSDGGAI